MFSAAPAPRSLPAALIALILLTTLTAAQPIPPLGELTATSAGGPGEIRLAWHTPLFELPEGQRDLEPCYQFRYASMPITASNWASALAFDTDFPAVRVDASANITLDVSVQAVMEGITMKLDEVYIRAWLTVWFQAGDLLPYGLPIRNELIQFTVRDDDGNTVTTGSDYTDDTGMADWYPGDVNDSDSCNQPNWPLYSFDAHWDGSSISVRNGMVITTGDRDDTAQMMTCDGEVIAPPQGSWSHWGGLYTYVSGPVMYEVYVPALAVTPEFVSVQLSTPSTVPPPIGMPPGVPGAMLAFNLEKADGPYLARPVVIEAEYPAGHLAQYGGLGESSLRAYRFEPGSGSWLPLDPTPFVIDREHHRVRFTTDRLGLFALAAEIDPDADGLGEFQELQLGLDPLAADTDDDGLSDGAEYWFIQSDPLDPLKTTAADQHAPAGGLVPGRGYYVAGRIVCGSEQSPVSDCVYVRAAGTVVGDLNCDGRVDFADINPFVLALTSPGVWEATYPDCELSRGDVNGDGVVGFGDLNPFVILLSGLL